MDREGQADAKLHVYSYDVSSSFRFYRTDFNHDYFF